MVYLLGLTIEAVNKHYKFDFEFVSKELVRQKQIYSPMSKAEASKAKSSILRDMNDVIIAQNIIKS